ncbi:hypothetical protein ElyMa_001186000 [Elysia marginata]|uniref:Uncharacterized protein n=1 Tax=Elysia marginata TaxID=1093978 RepID=A0AAV4I757_9GAST|nr:hypothetical protein ElyMa_001186000 [Elysia marginata]
MLVLVPVNKSSQSASRKSLLRMRHCRRPGGFRSALAVKLDGDRNTMEETTHAHPTIELPPEIPKEKFSNKKQDGAFTPGIEDIVVSTLHPR